MIKYPRALLKDFKDQYEHLVSLMTYKVEIDEWGEPYIPGKRGRVTPYANDGQVLCMYTTRPIILKRMCNLPWVTRHQIGDFEGYVKFSRKDIKLAAKFLGLKKKQGLSPEARANAIKRLKQYQFSSAGK